MIGWLVALRQGLMYTRFDLRVVFRSPGPWIKILVFPLAFMAGPAILTSLVGPLRSSVAQVWIEAEDTPAAWHGMWDELPLVDVVVVPQAPDRYDLQLDIPWPPVADALPSVTPKDGMFAREVEASARRRYVEVLAERLREPLPPIQIEGGDAVEVPWREPERRGLFNLENEDLPSMAMGAIGFLVIGVGGTGYGLGLGPALATSVREGFNRLLRLGVPVWSIYLSELLTMSVILLLEAVGWLVVGALAGGAATAYFGWTLTPDEWVASLYLIPWFIVLGPIAASQAASLSLVVARMVEVLTPQTREYLPGVLMLPVFSVMIYLPQLGWTQGSFFVAWLPVLGPVFTWWALVEQESWAVWAVLVQCGWAVASVGVGGWAFGLEESPVAWWRRRRRPAVAAG